MEEVFVYHEGDKVCIEFSPLEPGEDPVKAINNRVLMASNEQRNRSPLLSKGKNLNNNKTKGRHIEDFKNENGEYTITRVAKENSTINKDLTTNASDFDSGIKRRDSRNSYSSNKSNKQINSARSPRNHRLSLCGLGGKALNDTGSGLSDTEYDFEETTPNDMIKNEAKRKSKKSSGSYRRYFESESDTEDITSIAWIKNMGKRNSKSTPDLSKRISRSEGLTSISEIKNIGKRNSVISGDDFRRSSKSSTLVSTGGRESTSSEQQTTRQPKKPYPGLKLTLRDPCKPRNSNTHRRPIRISDFFRKL